MNIKGERKFSLFLLKIIDKMLGYVVEIYYFYYVIRVKHKSLKYELFPIKSDEFGRVEKP